MGQNQRRPTPGAAKSASSGPRDVMEYLELPLRRPFLFTIPLVIVVGAAVAASFLLPKRYKSSTLILVESDPVPESFVPKVSTERAGRRLQTLKQEVFSRTRLAMVAKELDPYGAMVTDGVAGTVERMGKALAVTLKSNDAFGIEFTHSDPRMAQKVANRVTQLFIEQAIEMRKAQVNDAYQFIESELDEARRQVEKREEALRVYKEEHMGTLPEQLNSNLATLQRLQIEYQAVSDSLRSAMDRVVMVESSTVVKGTPSADPRLELRQLKGDLASMRVRYTDEHPDVRSLQGRIDSLEKAIAAAGLAASPPERPQAIQERLEVRDLTEKRSQLEGKIAALQSRVDKTPKTEQELSTLTRDYDKLNENYLTLLKKKMDAQMAAKLEQRWQGDRFRVLDPANLPESPSFPQPWTFIIAGVVTGLLAGMGTCFVADFLDQSVRNVRELEQLLPYPVLAVLPFIVPEKETRRRGQPRPPGGRGNQVKHASFAGRSGE